MMTAYVDISWGVVEKRKRRKGGAGERARPRGKIANARASGTDAASGTLRHRIGPVNGGGMPIASALSVESGDCTGATLYVRSSFARSPYSVYLSAIHRIP
jgi:hypothetical protein